VKARQEVTRGGASRKFAGQFKHLCKALPQARAGPGEQAATGMGQRRHPPAHAARPLRHPAKGLRLGALTALVALAAARISR
jgi:hypothetical protein